MHSKLKSLDDESFNVKVSMLDVYNQFKQGKFKNVVLPPFELTADDEKKLKKEKFKKMVMHVPEKLTLQEKLKVMNELKTIKSSRKLL